MRSLIPWVRNNNIILLTYWFSNPTWDVNSRRFVHTTITAMYADRNWQVLLCKSAVIERNHRAHSSRMFKKLFIVIGRRHYVISNLLNIIMIQIQNKHAQGRLQRRIDVYIICIGFAINYFFRLICARIRVRYTILFANMQKAGAVFVNM